jgi:mono/diheme cytochrome c family protein
LLEQQRLDEKQWTPIVKRMQSWGSQVADKDISGLSAFLAERYGPDAKPFTPKPIEASALAERFAPLSDEGFGGGDPVRGAEAFRSYCIDCHGADAKGGSVGIKLVDNPILARAPDIVKTIRTGRGRMGAFPSIGDADIRAIIAFLRSRKSN